MVVNWTIISINRKIESPVHLNSKNQEGINLSSSDHNFYNSITSVLFLCAIKNTLNNLRLCPFQIKY